ncbi:MAG: ASKHA domain-containing protein [Clostridiales Family XIII bacterium]|jgi:uncharacterized 2Fe-2S/4Fe-4S cluster protein (DUF4445 family)|nr:ASKHA domain-containing protein [Clostridiales Family XIII bacterium]
MTLTETVAKAAASRYGVAFDIGTTTAAGMLWDMVSGKPAGALAKSNPQRACGADVMSRIAFAVRENGEDNPEKLRGLIVRRMNEITTELSGNHGIDLKDIHEIAVCGNTAMSHFFAGKDPAGLALSPFRPAYTGALCGSAASFGLAAADGARCYLMPGIAGHVGSDITAGVLATGLHRIDGASLLIDIGTNGEIVLAAGGRLTACSTAAGPAFEGASIAQGMRAEEGAVEAVKISGGEVSVGVIGDAAPAGLCGSGVIDAAAEMLGAGIIDETGKIFDRGSLLSKGVSAKLASRVRENGGEMEFVLAYGGGEKGKKGKDIVIRQKDIREFQMAKGAIEAGVTMLLREMKLRPADIGNVFLAGAFGNHIRAESAVAAGLIPAADLSNVIFAGNTAGAGVSMALLSDEVKRQAEALAANIEHLELAARADFQDVYIAAMNFRHYRRARVTA